jgi:hypothetical protein
MKVNSWGAASWTVRQVAVDGPSNSRVEKKLSATALSQQLPLRLMLCTAPTWARSPLKLLAANSKPRSEWNNSPGPGCRRENAPPRPTRAPPVRFPANPDRQRL